MKRTSNFGFTLVELLVVITIIGILIALLLPAVQAAREAARMAQCRNQVKQLALGCLHHESVIHRLPPDGWGYCWTGDADEPPDRSQPGGWIYKVLPYVEQQALHDLGAGLPTAQKNAANLQRICTPLPLLYCPTRRRAMAYPWVIGVTLGYTVVNCAAPIQVCARTDYAACLGDIYVTSGWGVWPSWQRCQSPSADGGPASLADGGAVNASPKPTPAQAAAARTTFNAVAAQATGVMYCGSLTKLSDVTDGTSNTYLLGEKNLCPDYYTTGMSGGDNEDAYMGDDIDIFRVVGYSPGTPYVPPWPDTPGSDQSDAFGSAHLSGFNMAFCDGSVHTMSFTIAPEAHRRLGNRKDGEVIDGKSF